MPSGQTLYRGFRDPLFETRQKRFDSKRSTCGAGKRKKIYAMSDLHESGRGDQSSGTFSMRDFAPQHANSMICESK